MLALEYAMLQYNLSIKSLPLMAYIPPSECRVNLNNAFKKTLRILSLQIIRYFILNHLPSDRKLSLNT